MNSLHESTKLSQEQRIRLKLANDPLLRQEAGLQDRLMSTSPLLELLIDREEIIDEMALVGELAPTYQQLKDDYWVAIDYIADRKYQLSLPVGQLSTSGRTDPFNEP